MALDFYKINFIQEALHTQSLNTVWMRLLKTYIIEYAAQNNTEDFSTNDDFRDFERFDNNILSGLSLVEISLFYEYSLALYDRDKRKQSGAYYTPEDIAVFMSEKSKHFEKDKKWLDPCSGIGNLSYHLASVQEDPEYFVQYNLVLQDIDELALKIAHCIFALHFQNKVQDFYGKIAENFIVKDFLEDYDKDQYTGKNNSSVFSSYQKVSYDYVIVNPPYFSALQNPKFITSKSRDLYSYFLERIIFESQGFISITPQSFINSNNFSDLRNILLENMNHLFIYAFDNIPDSIFRGYKYGSENSNTVNSVRASIIVARKDENTSHRITPMLRWKTSERKKAIKNFDDQLAPLTLEKNKLFPKLSKETVDLYNRVFENRKLSEIISSHDTEHKLIIPATPRYFITASKTPLNRSSFHTLNFESEELCNQAYLLLNSSYMYWWWRVNDGGMTLSKKTLLSLPLINVDVNDSKILDMIELLENSERINKVSKKNAGKNNENIKHPSDLVRKLNALLFTDSNLSQSLYNVHDNSFLND